MMLKGWVTKRSWEAVRWLETEGFEGQASEAERPASGKHKGAGVRALIVAMKPSNAGGAKGCRKVET
jgi:hypothetical protein